MGAAAVAEFLSLPAEERLRLLELLWESLTAAPSSMPLGDAHRAAIDEALAEYRQNPDDVLTFDQVSVLTGAGRRTATQDVSGLPADRPCVVSYLHGRRRGIGAASESSFELIPGPWTIEIWYGDQRLTRKTFRVLPLKAAKP